MEDELILVEKDGEQIRVHPLALDDHKRLGWKVVKENDDVEAEAAPKGEKKPKGEKRPRTKRGAAKKAAEETAVKDSDKE